ncbi:MAG: hypothetical protein KDA86_19195 [Planctomycetaceae bacterium]|nr:hypothetical protein [Planctomycetaceae bacterium]
MSLTRADLDDFHEFALGLIEEDGSCSLGDCVRRWEDHKVYEASVAAIREGLADSAAGRSQTVEEAFADIRRELGLPERRPVP